MTPLGLDVVAGACAGSLADPGNDAAFGRDSAVLVADLRTGVTVFFGGKGFAFFGARLSRRTLLSSVGADFVARSVGVLGWSAVG